CKASGTSSFVLGNGPNSTSILENSVGYSLMMGFNSDKPTFFVGESGGAGTTGSIGIGDVTDPQAKLHIKADDGEPARLFIEPHTFGVGNSELWLGTEDYGLTASYNRLNFKTESYYLFNSENANVGIGVLNPHEKLEVNGNIKQSLGFFLETDKVKAAGENGLKLHDGTGQGPIITNGGKVGFGVLNPSHALDVDGTIATTGFQLNYGGGTSNPEGYDGWVLQADDLGNASWTNPLLLNVDDNDWAMNGNDMYNVNIGNVGIGVQIPTEKLDVAGTVKATAFIGDGSGLTNIDDDDWVVGTNKVYRLTGNVGIGTSSPNAQLELADIFSAGGMNLKIGNDIYLSDMDIGNTLGILGCQDNTIGKIKLGTNGPVLTGKQGKLGIGTTPVATLDVNGSIKANSINVSTMNVAEMTMETLTVSEKIWAAEIEVTEISEWKDYIFDENYLLPSLSEVEQFINNNHHLPGIPSEAEVMQNGINIGEMNALLLQKIEELTLYVIELEKKISNNKITQ
ncbi:MAG: hypothetical protein K8S16_09620, partial [Bacteroidales bacterium]|nr:hypothetical protein [Bacteroidales bacterium]